MALSDEGSSNEEEALPRQQFDSIEDRVLVDERRGGNGYISDSDVEEEGFLDASDAPRSKGYPGKGGNATGPKGVMSDYREHQQQLYRENASASRALVEAAKKMTMNEYLEPSDEEDDSKDEFLKEYRARRIAEMTRSIANRSKFGSLIFITADQYLDAIDNETEDVYVAIHLYKSHIPQCVKMNEILTKMAKAHPVVKFCAIIATEASAAFRDDAGLPAILVYKAGELVANLVDVVGEMDGDLEYNRLQELLARYGICSIHAPLDDPRSEDEFD